ncbi:centrosomal protein of 135 kDa-like isoform X1 [Hippocampus comes]|uniref:centrosomal protein of 135 kDa-like isoform X1 n=1 Tax=Hippocampus comes TaxID=109280 RepID=UPI00094ECDAA|nr:PREDICTED: centrosomal protein of 135 kDa-like isoform X1 [Hippocampus comes]
MSPEMPQRMQTHEVIPAPNQPPPKSPDHSYGDERHPVADGRLLGLQEDVSKVKSDLDNAHGCIKLLLIQVAERDKKIDNLNHALHGPRDTISLDAQNNANKKLIAYLTLQIEYLQESNRTLEQKLEALQNKSSAEVADLSLKNIELCRELTQKNNMIKQTKMDKKRVLDIAYRNLSASKEVIISQQEVIKDLEDNLVKMRAESQETNSGTIIGLDRIIDLENAVQNLERERLELRSQLSLLRDAKWNAEPRWDYQPAERLQDAEKEEAAAAATKRRKAAHAPSQLQGLPKSQERDLAALPQRPHDPQESIVRENMRLQDDLTALTKEKQAAHAGMEVVLRERDELKLSVHSYANAMYRVEDLLRTKDQENFELMAHLRAAQSDLQERERRLQQVEDLIAAIGVELRKAQDGPAALLSDLSCIRELCARLDTDKELAACALTSKSIELDLVKKQLESEKATVRNLETLLAAALQKVSDREAKLRALRDRLTAPAENMTGDCNRASEVANPQAPQRQMEMNNRTNARSTGEQHVSFRD